MVIQEGTLLQGTYRLVRRIGHGGMGEVWEATHARLAGRYAVKFVLADIGTSPEAVARFRREAEVTSALQHPNIVQVIDFNTTPKGVPYLVMELLRGQSLAAVLQDTGALPLGRCLGIVRETASALKAAHDVGVVHRDLKPENIFLVPLQGPTREFVKILDFGISKVRAATRSLTGSATIMGTPSYMSPEQAEAKVGEIDHRTDQFALAAIAYEILAGHPAFFADDPIAILYQVVHKEPPPLPVTPSLPAAVGIVVAAGLSKDKSRRFPTILEFATALEAAAASGSGTRHGYARFEAGANEPTQIDAVRTPHPVPVPPPTAIDASEGDSQAPTGRVRRAPATTTFRTATGETGGALRPIRQHPRGFAVAAAALLAFFIYIGMRGLNVDEKAKTVPPPPAMPVVKAAATDSGPSVVPVGPVPTPPAPPKVSPTPPGAAPSQPEARERARPAPKRVQPKPPRASSRSAAPSATGGWPAGCGSRGQTWEERRDDERALKDLLDCLAKMEGRPAVKAFCQRCEKKGWSKGLTECEARLGRMP